MAWNDKEARRAYNLKYREAHKEEIRAQRKAHDDAHREEIRERHRAYHHKNKDAKNAQRRENYQKNREHALAQMRAYNARNKEAFKKRHKANAERRAIRAKREFLEMYGKKCVCCGEDTFEFLTVEHVKGVNRTCFKTGVAAYKEAIKQYNPEEYSVLCYNCNLATKLGRTCPHKTKK
jgi:hypothetical protein